jgi:hypothetical protein
MSDGEIEGNGSCDDCHPDEEHGEQSNPERNAIIENPVPVQVDDPAFILPGCETGRAEVLAIPCHVAQGAQESSAMIARDDRLLLGMIKTARLIIHQTLSRGAEPKAARKGGKHIDLDRNMTGWA